jgi:hypothetical protein
MRKAVSVTIDEDNLLWLKAQAAASARGSLSAILDRIVAEARAQGRAGAAAMKSVAGTIDLPAGDPDLEGASSYVRALFERSLRRPLSDPF